MGTVQVKIYLRWIAIKNYRTGAKKYNINFI